MLTVLSKDQKMLPVSNYPIIFTQKNLVNDMTRYAILVPVDKLAEYLIKIEDTEVVLEHIYDY
jgi:hypothetical protein